MARKIDPTKRSAILSAARTILLRDGYAATKMSDIALEAGVAPGTLYLYFDSKEALANAIGEDFFTRLSTAFAEALTGLDSPSKLQALVDWASRIGEQEKDLFKLFKQQVPDQKKEEGPRLLFRNQLAAALSNLMQLEDTRKYDPHFAADIVMGVLHSVLMWCASEPLQEGAHEAIRETAIRVLQHALFTDAGLAKIETK